MATQTTFDNASSPPSSSSVPVVNNNSSNLVPTDNNNNTDNNVPSSNNNADNTNSDFSIRFFATDSEVGSIIGLRGENIKNFRSVSRARINVTDDSICERIVTVRGNGDQITTAIQLILQKFEADRISSSENQDEYEWRNDEMFNDGVSLRLIVPNTNCGSLIGQNGSNIKELREKTGARIQVANMLLPKSTEREVSISGSINKVVECVRRLTDIAVETKPTVHHIPYISVDNGEMSYRRKQAADVWAKALRKSKGPESKFIHDDYEYRKTERENFTQDYGFSTEKIVVPNQLVGFIIGKNGSRINEIRQNSGAHIKIVENVVRNKVDSAARLFIITGARANVQSAMHSIQTAKMRRNRALDRAAVGAQDEFG